MFSYVSNVRHFLSSCMLKVFWTFQVHRCARSVLQVEWEVWKRVICQFPIAAYFAELLVLKASTAHIFYISINIKFMYFS